MSSGCSSTPRIPTAIPSDAHLCPQHRTMRSCRRSGRLRRPRDTRTGNHLASPRQTTSNRSRGAQPYPRHAMLRERSSASGTRVPGFVFGSPAHPRCRHRLINRVRVGVGLRPPVVIARRRVERVVPVRRRDGARGGHAQKTPRRLRSYLEVSIVDTLGPSARDEGRDALGLSDRSRSGSRSGKGVAPRGATVGGEVHLDAGDCGSYLLAGDAGESLERRNLFRARHAGSCSGGGPCVAWR